MKKNKGFTLVEILVVASIISITLAIGMPSLKNATKKNTMAGQINSFIGLTNYARSEAIKRGTTISICASNTNGTACSTIWNNGAIAFIDSNSNGTFEGGDTLLRVTGNIIGGNTFKAVISGTTTTVSSIGYISSGGSTNTSNVDITVCSPTIHASRILTITASGQTKSVAGTC